MRAQTHESYGAGYHRIGPNSVHISEKKYSSDSRGKQTILLKFCMVVKKSIDITEVVKWDGVPGKVMKIGVTVDHYLTL